MFEKLKKDLQDKMNESFRAFEEQLKGLRTGRASSDLINNILVDAYGGKMPLNQLASVVVQGPLTLNVQIWDDKMIPAIDKAIRESDLGLNPQEDMRGTLRIPLPEMTGERRQEMTKKLGTYTENAKISIRSTRKSGMDALKKAEKNKEISADDLHTYEKIIQTLTDAMIEKVAQLAKTREKDLLSI